MRDSISFRTSNSRPFEILRAAAKKKRAVEYLRDGVYIVKMQQLQTSFGVISLDYSRTNDTVQNCQISTRVDTLSTIF